MSEGITPAVLAGSWVKDPDAYDPNSRVRAFVFNDHGYIARSGMAGQADAWPIVVRDAATGDYVATVANWLRLPAELAARLAESTGA